jgi:hypothetical protein
VVSDTIFCNSILHDYVNRQASQTYIANRSKTCFGCYDIESYHGQTATVESSVKSKPFADPIVLLFIWLLNYLRQRFVLRFFLSFIVETVHGVCLAQSDVVVLRNQLPTQLLQELEIQRFTMIYKVSDQTIHERSVRAGFCRTKFTKDMRRRRVCNKLRWLFIKRRTLCLFFFYWRDEVVPDVLESLRYIFRNCTIVELFENINVFNT